MIYRARASIRFFLSRGGNSALPPQRKKILVVSGFRRSERNLSELGGNSNAGDTRVVEIPSFSRSVCLLLSLQPVSQGLPAGGGYNPSPTSAASASSSTKKKSKWFVVAMCCCAPVLVCIVNFHLPPKLSRRAVSLGWSWEAGFV